VTIITKGCLLEQAEKEHKGEPANQVQLDNGSQDGTRMWANAQRDGRPAEYRWRPLFNAAKFG